MTIRRKPPRHVRSIGWWLGISCLLTGSTAAQQLPVHQTVTASERVRKVRYDEIAPAARSQVDHVLFRESDLARNDSVAVSHEVAGDQSIRPASFVQSVVTGDYTATVGGYVKADFIRDFNAIGSTDAFDPATIPTDGRPGENTRFHARQSRLNLDFRTNSDCDELRLFVEGDFFGGGDAFRLRHAYIDIGQLLVGQTWSTFMDESVLPSTLDFESPRSIILDRRAMLRWTQAVTDSVLIAGALEDPQPLFDVAVAPAGSIERSAPDLIARTRYEHAWGHLQAATLVRLLRYRQTVGLTDDAVGWGFNFTGRVNPHEFDSILFQFAYGEGIESYRQGNDAAVNAAGGLEVLPVVAWVAGYEIDWTERVSSTFVYSVGRITNATFQVPTAGRLGEYVAANVVFRPRPQLSWGIEYLYGTRKDKNGAKGDAHRLQFSVRYDLL